MEKLGLSNAALLAQVTNGAYTPNPACAKFDIESVLASIDLAGDAVVGDPDAFSHQAARRPALHAGAQVAIIGLKAQPHFNGEGGVVVHYNPVNGRWEVKIHS